MMTGRGVVMSVVIALALAACGGDDGGGDEDAGPMDAGAGGGTLIRAAEGGTVMSEDGVFRLVIPPGALSEDVAIRVRRLAPEDWTYPFRERVPGSDAYEVLPDLEFAVPASAEFHYPAAPPWARGAMGEWGQPYEWAIRSELGTATLSRSTRFSVAEDGTYRVQATIAHSSTHVLRVESTTVSVSF